MGRRGVGEAQSYITPQECSSVDFTAVLEVNAVNEIDDSVCVVVVVEQVGGEEEIRSLALSG